MKSSSALVAAALALTALQARAQAATELDLVLEQMAEHITFEDKVEDAEVKLLAAAGYGVGARVTGSHAIIMRVFPAKKAGLLPVVAFRGTVFKDLSSLLDDLDPKSVGYSAFKDNRDLIRKTIASAAGNGRVLVSGFSLGAALAMRAAVEFPQLVGRIVTFHPPGILKSEVEALRRYNQQHPKLAISSSHFQEDHDLVSKSGEAFTDGTIHDYRVEGVKIDFLTWHCTYLLADVALAHGRSLPAHDNKRKVVFVKDEPSSAKITSAPETLREMAGVPATAVASGVSAVSSDASKAADAAKSDANKAGDAAKSEEHKAASDAKSGEHDVKDLVK